MKHKTCPSTMRKFFSLLSLLKSSGVTIMSGIEEDLCQWHYPRLSSNKHSLQLLRHQNEARNEKHTKCFQEDCVLAGRLQWLQSQNTSFVLLYLKCWEKQTQEIIFLNQEKTFHGGQQKNPLNIVRVTEIENYIYCFFFCNELTKNK